MKTALPLIFALAASGLALANEAGTWTSVTIHATHQETETVVQLEGTETLSKVVLSIAGKDLEVPAPELSGIEVPRLDTARVLFGEDYYGPVEAGEKPIPHYIIELKYGDRTTYGGFSRVQFLFHSGAFQKRTVQIQEAETVWRNYLKYPGEEEKEVGTTTRPPERTR